MTSFPVRKHSVVSIDAPWFFQCIVGVFLKGREHPGALERILRLRQPSKWPTLISALPGEPGSRSRRTPDLVSEFHPTLKSPPSPPLPHPRPLYYHIHILLPFEENDTWDTASHVFLICSLTQDWRKTQFRRVHTRFIVYACRTI